MLKTKKLSVYFINLLTLINNVMKKINEVDNKEVENVNII